MSSISVTQAKEDGSNAWSRGDFSGSIKHFTTAIDLAAKETPLNKAVMKLLYSNRSAAFLKIGQIENALSDGSKCVEIDSQWPKGYTRKGDALYSLRRYTEAYNAYNSALRYAPGDSTIQEKVDKAMNGIANESSNGRSSGSSNSSTYSSIEGFPFCVYLRYAIFGFALVYFIPFIGRTLNQLAFRLSAASFIADQAACIVKKHGLPKWSQEYAARVVSDQAMVRVMLGALVAMSFRPYFFALVPILITNLTFFIPKIFQYARENATELENKVYPLVARFAPSLGRISISQIFSANMIPQAEFLLLRVAATAELSQGLFHLFELFLPTRSIFQTYIWWQYLRMRYMQDNPSGHVRAAFKDMDQKIRQLLHHQYCPALVRQVYGYITAYMAKQVELPSPGSNSSSSASSGGIPSMLSKCNIM